MSTDTISAFKVRISKDHLSATVETDRDAELSEVSAGDVVAALEAARVAIDDQVTQRATEFVEALRNPEGPPEGEFQIAAGHQPTEGEDGTFTWEESVAPKAADENDDEAFDYYNVSAITTVEEGTLIGSITPPKPGANGVDVHGSPLHPKGRPQEVTLKKGVKLGDDGSSVIATVAGRVVFQNFELSIDEVVEIAGDVNFETGNLDLSTDVMDRGTSQANQAIAEVITLNGTTPVSFVGLWSKVESVEAADVEVAGNVTVRGGILKRAKGKVIAGGDIMAKFCDEANLCAQGDIRVAREIINSYVYAEGKLLLPQGTIIGGEAFGWCAVEVGTLGSDAGVRTTVVVGLHPDHVRQVEETAKENERRHASMEKIRQAVDLLMAQSKRLTDKQREKAAELMCQADAIEAEISKSEKEAPAVFASDSEESKPYVLISSQIYPGVSILISDRIVTFQEEMKGPVKIERRKIDNYTAIAAVNQLTGSVQELPVRGLKPQPDKTGSAQNPPESAA